MAGNDTFVQFRNLITDLYPDKRDCRRICSEVGLSVAYMDFDGRMINVWDDAARRAHQQYKLIELVKVVQAEFGDVPSIKQLWSLAEKAQIQPLPGDVSGTTITFDDNDRVQLVSILVEWTEFRENARARRVFLELLGIAQLLPGFDWEGEPQTVAGDLVLRLESLPPLSNRPDFHPLGKLLDFLRCRPDIAESHSRVCARLIVRYRLVRTPDYLEDLCKNYALDEERLPKVGVHQANISDGLAARRNAANSVKAMRSYDLDHDRILREFDLDRQMEEITSRLGQLPRGGLTAFAVAGDYALIADYLVPRLLTEVRNRLAYELVPHDAYLHLSSVGEIEISFAGMEPNEMPQDLPLSWTGHLLRLASEENTHRLMKVWNHSLPSPQMEVFASRFVIESPQDFVALLHRHGLLYVFVWISLQPHEFSEQEALCCLSPFKSLDPDFVRRWFQMKLSDAGVAPLDIDRAVSRLTKQLQANHGVPQFVFHAIREIIDDLNQGKI